jgi:predicted TIM-barrel fold metal-dependent hydrolase
LSPRARAAAADSDLPEAIIDTHQHLWDLKRFRLPWLDGAGDVLNRTHTMGDYLRAAEGLNVVQAVYMEVDVDARQRAEEAEYVVQLCRDKKGPTVAAVIGGAPERDDFDAYIGRFKDSPYVKGIRSSFDAGRGSERFLKSLRLLGQMHMSYDINTGPAGLEAAAAVVGQCPETRFVLDHCGNIDPALFRKDAAADSKSRAQWERGIAAVAGHSNVVCKISGVMEAGKKGQAGPDEYAAVIHYCIDHFGPDRVIFASNWPVVNLGGSFRQWVRVVREAIRDRSKADRAKLFHDNAQRFYGLAKSG